MKQFVTKILLFFVLAAVIDIACGWAFNELRSKARGGQSFKNEYISNVCEDELLILGSSKAAHHYVSSVFRDSLGVSCYNAGEEGCGIIPAYMRYHLVCSRKKPKMVLYDLAPAFDYYQDMGGYGKYLGIVRPYADRLEVEKMYLDFSDELEKIRLVSAMYRNNSKLIGNLKDMLSPAPELKGYEPLYGKMATQTTGTKTKVKEGTERAIDEKKLNYLERLIKEAQSDGVKIVFIISPTIYDEGDLDYKPAYDLCETYNVPMINNLNCGFLRENTDLFQDRVHLNDKGAILYSDYVVQQIKGLL